MDTKIALPAILRRRAERILRSSVRAAYRVSADNPNIVRCVLKDGSFKYVDLSEQRELKHAEIKVSVEPAPPEANPDAVIPIEEEVEAPKKSTRKKRVVTKEKQSKKGK